MIDRDLSRIFPALAADVNRFVNAWNLNHPDHPIQVFEALRDHKRQAELYAQGRTAPGPIVTNAAPGTSWHNFGFAVDVVFDADPVKPGPPMDVGRETSLADAGRHGPGDGVRMGGSLEAVFRNTPTYKRLTALP